MAKKNKTGLYIGIGVGILAIGGLVFFLIKRKRAKAMMTNFPVADTNPSSSGGGGGSSRNQDFPLKKGSLGERVKNIQKYLNSTKQKPNLVVDGDFGSKTLTALKNWNQKSEITKGFYEYLDKINFKSKS